MLYSMSGCVDEEPENLGDDEDPKQTIHFVFVLGHSLDSLWELDEPFYHKIMDLLRVHWKRFVILCMENVQ
jgi:hypothetical protein